METLKSNSLSNRPTFQVYTAVLLLGIQEGGSQNTEIHDGVNSALITHLTHCVCQILSDIIFDAVTKNEHTVWCGLEVCGTQSVFPFPPIPTGQFPFPCINIFIPIPI